MLHIVQVVMWGVAEPPQLFLDEARARTAYVEGVRKHWGQRYAAYCEHHGLSGDAFAAAQAFAGTIDVSEKSGIHCWSFEAQAIDPGAAKNPLAGAGPEALGQVAAEIDAVRAGLARLLEDLSRLSDRIAGMGIPQPAAASVDESKQTVPAPAAARPEVPEPDPATRATPEWQSFVGSIRRLASGSRNEFHLLHRDDWRQEVYGHRTSLEYWDWVADRLRRHKERAVLAGYAVIEDPDAPGCYRFADRQGTAGEECCDSEWEAWCAAGLDLEAKGRDAAG